MKRMATGCCLLSAGVLCGLAQARAVALWPMEYDTALGAVDLRCAVSAANDKMFYALDFFFDNLASDTAVLKSLSALNLGDQYCLKTARACRQVAVLSSRKIGSGECAKLQRRSDTQRMRAAAVVDRIMDENRRDGLLFKELLEQKVEEFA